MLDDVHILRLPYNDVAVEVHIPTRHAVGVPELPRPVREVDFHSRAHDLLVALLKNDVPLCNDTLLLGPVVNVIRLKSNVAVFDIDIAARRDVPILVHLFVGLDDHLGLRRRGFQRRGGGRSSTKGAKKGEYDDDSRHDVIFLALDLRNISQRMERLCTGDPPFSSRQGPSPNPCPSPGPEIVVSHQAGKRILCSSSAAESARKKRSD